MTNDLNFLADVFLGSGALAAAFYCLILSRRLSKLTGLDQELGGAIAVLSRQVDEMTRVLGAAQETAKASSGTLDHVTVRAEKVADHLEILMSALHDLPDLSSSEPSQANTQKNDISVFLRHGIGSQQVRNDA